MSPAAALAPLISREHARGIEERLRPFRQRRVLESLDVHVVDQLAELAGETDPDVALALALVVRAPRFGHICVELASLEAEHLTVEAEDEPREPLRLPQDRKAWLNRIAESPLVRSGDSSGPTRPFVLHRGKLYSARYFAYQERLASQLRARVTTVLLPHNHQLLQQGLSALFPSREPEVDRQKLGAAMALLRGFTVISGGPGTGKTYTVRNVLTLLFAQWALQRDPTDGTAGPRVALAAPTGKAAARMQESILLERETYLDLAEKALPPNCTRCELYRFLTSLQPCTIHRLLRWNRSNPTRFRHHADNPLPYDVVVVDEASMVDFALMTKLVDAVRPDARLLLLGDQHQLASVEAGTVLADLCGPTSVCHLRVSSALAEQLRTLAGLGAISELATIADTGGPHDAIVQLDKNRRFGDDSGIGQFARACLADDFDPEVAVSLLAGAKQFNDVALLPHGLHGSLVDESKELIVKEYRPYLEALLAGPGPGETLAALHLRVLTLFDKFRILCAHRGGNLGVEGMNQRVVHWLAGAGLSGFHPRGEYWVGRPILVRSNDYVVHLFNGDVGIIVTDHQGERKVAFPDPTGVRYIAPSRLPEHQTVFAMTIHKSQGSEFGHAMVTLPEHDSPILTRELIYTAVTRAQLKVTLLGDPSLLADALTKTVRRASGLEAELWHQPQPAPVRTPQT